jgi:hypothetical protein
MALDASSSRTGGPAGSTVTSTPAGAFCAGLGLRPDDVILHLHQEILEMMPMATARLARNGRPLCRRLALAVLDAGAADQPGGAQAMMRRVGADNYADGFPTDQYGSIVHALLRAVRGSYGGEWTNALSSGCVEYFIWVRDQLTAGARAAQQPEHGNRTAKEPEVAPAPEAASMQTVDDEDAEDSGYGELMVAMTLNSKREKRHRRSR